MNNFLKLNNEDKKRIIINTSRKMNMSEAIIEKDFWVCWVLKYLFSQFGYKDYISFKGGTSLSKIYNCIERFSEDIDLAIDWSVLGIVKDETYEERSKRQQEFFNKTSNLKTEDYLKNVWLPLIDSDFSKLINEEYTLYIDPFNSQTICFQYPKIYFDTSVLQIIRIEIGVLAEPIPSNQKTIKTYIGQCYPTIFKNEEIEVRAVDAKRTFFEKIAILHREANRINEHYPARYSRHYYDVYQMIQKNIANESLKHIDLLEKVISFNKKFYTCNWAKYDEILDGKCKLVPNENAIVVFSKDYESMKNMFYGKYPSFLEIIHSLDKFETIFNNAIKDYSKQ